jgi:hypothetical protein
MHVIPFRSNRDRIAPKTTKHKLPQITASKGQELYAIRRRDGKYFHFCYANGNIAHAVLVKLFSVDEANFVRSTDNTTLSRITKPEHLV